MMNTLFRTPFDTGLAQLAREMDHAFASPRAERSVALNAWRSDDGFVVEAEIPGFSIDEVEVFAEGNSLTLRAERTPSEQESSKTLHRERTRRAFDRTLRLPAELDAERVSATLNDGGLRVTLPLASHAKPKRIEVRTGAALPSPSEN